MTFVRRRVLQRLIGQHLGCVEAQQTPLPPTRAVNSGRHEKWWSRWSGLTGMPNNSMQRTALGAAVNARC